jgi:hypothetical protein
MKHFRILLSCFLLFLTPRPSQGQEGTIEVPFDEDWDFYLDSDAHQGKCLAASILKDQGMLFEIESPKLAPGAYRAHIRLKISHTISEHTSRLSFIIGAQSSTRDFTQKNTILGFELPGKYQDFVLPVMADASSKHLSFSFTWKWSGPRGSKRPPEPVKPPEVQTDGSLEVEKEEIEALERKLTDLPFHLAVDRIWLVPVGDVEVEDFTVDKLRYRPGEKATVSGTIRNLTKRERNVQVKILLIGGLDEEKEITSYELKLAPDGSEPVRVEALLNERLWGHEARCIITEDGREVGRASEVFTVHTNPWAVAIAGFSMDLTVYRAGPDKASAMRGALGRKASYQNTVEFVFWAPDDFGNFNPSGEFFSGQMHRHNSAESTQRLTEAFRQVGVACSVYAKNGTGGGKAGYEILRKHPEWYEPGFYDVAQLDRWDRSPEMSSWPTLGAQHDLEEPFIHHADELIKSVESFGWDMIRYDSHMQQNETGDITRLVKSKVNKAHPLLQWGYNTGLHRTRKQPPVTGASWAKPGGQELKPVFDELCKDGGMIMDEWNNHAAKGWSYRKYASRHISIRDVVHPKGGHLVFCPFDVESHADAVYQDILPMAAMAHRAWDPLKSFRPYAFYARFATRFAGFLWDNKCRRAKDARDWIDWGEADKKLFLWDSYVYWRPRGENATELIMHMVNMPPERVASYKDCRVPEPLVDTRCALQLPNGLGAQDLWVATTEPDMKLEKLSLKKQGSKVEFTVPKLRFWNVLVLRAKGAVR